MTDSSLIEEQSAARCPGESYQDLLDREHNPVPAALRESTNTYLGSDRLSVDRYLSREFHDLEVQFGRFAARSEKNGRNTTRSRDSNYERQSRDGLTKPQLAYQKPIMA